MTLSIRPIGTNKHEISCGKCGVEFSEAHPRCCSKGWAICVACYNEHNRFRRRKGRPAKATNCNNCGEAFTVNNPRCRDKRAWCKLCVAAKQREWCRNHPEVVARRKQEMKARLVPKYRKMVWDAYGNVCACCGEAIPEFLTFEHRNGGGNLHRRRRNIIGVLLDIIRAGFPPEFCLYCSNCNFATSGGRKCPHELARLQVVGPAKVAAA